MDKQKEIEAKLQALYSEERRAKREAIQSETQEQGNSLEAQIAMLERQRDEIERNELLREAERLQAEADGVIVALFQSVKALNECANRLKDLQRSYMKARPHGKYSELNIYSLDIDNYIKTTRLWLNIFSGDTVGVRGKLACLVRTSDKER